jgi:NAD(P)-dependent dehydrogenase (short-subunit alcohol dehydrogenase family)
MTATTHPEYNSETEALDVAKAFPEAIRGKTVLVTGVNLKGIGFATAQAFASQAPAHLILAGRNKSKLQECIEELKKEYPNLDYRALILDLSSQKAVRIAAQEVLSWNDVPSIDILVNNAGVASIPKRTLSEEGIEMTFATNHIGHFLFTCLIMPKLIQAAKVNPKGATRIVNVSSRAAEVNGIRWSDLNFEKKSRELPDDEQPNYTVHKLWGITDGQDLSYIPWEAYIQSKAANVLLSIALTKRLYEEYGILSVAPHPGVIATELTRHSTKEQMDAIKAREQRGEFSYKTLGQGAATTLVAAVDPKLGVSETRDGKEGYGAYLMDCQISQNAHPRAKSSDEAEKLWKLSEDLVGEKFSW